MNVRDLIREIYRCRLEYKDFLDWEVAVEHHKNPKKCVNCKNNMLKDGEEWEYIKCHGFWTKFVKEKVFSVNIHY